MARIFQFVKNNWKKITFASVALGYGGNYLWTEHEISSHMQSVCRNLPDTSSKSPLTAVVILNPVANKKKCEKFFRKYCEPILHLAGYSVDVVKTKEVGNAKSLIETLPFLPDVLVIAGGDGTSSEVVTGLLRRKDDPCPILILPLGEKNETVSSFMSVVPKQKLEYVKCLSSCLLSMLQERLQYHNVLKYEVMGTTDEAEEPHKPIYGLQKFSWGLLRDIEAKKDKYWYVGSLRHHAAALTTALSNEMAKTIQARLTCTPPCPGCNTCVVVKSQKQRVFNKLFTPTARAESNVPVMTNEVCGNKENYDIQAKQVNIACQQNDSKFSELNTEVIETISNGIDFIKNIKKKVEPTLQLRSRTVELIPVEAADMMTYSIDGEEYEARPIKISLVPNSVKMYC